MNFRGVTKSYRINFGAVEPNPFSTKRYAETKKETLGNVHSQGKIMDTSFFLSGCHGNSKILGYIYFSFIKVYGLCYTQMTSCYLLHFTKSK